MITLLTPPRRAWLMGFWLAISLCSGLLVGTLLAVLISLRWFGLGMILALGLAVPGLLWSQAVTGLYMAWNRLARYFGLAARLWLHGICFYMIFVAVGRAGSSLGLARPTSTESLWVPRGPLATSTYGNQYNAATGASGPTGSMSTYLSWAVHSGNMWAISLVPFFILLSALKIDRTNSDFPEHIYTLF